MIMRLRSWNADSIVGKMREASRQGVDRTMAEAVLIAQERAPRDTGFMASTIEILQPSVTTGNVTSGLWGNATADYTLWVEIGSQGRPGKYFLRTAADECYPRLGDNIQRAWRGLA